MEKRAAESIQSDEALEAAGVCVWDWSPATQKLRVRARGRSAIGDVEGDWRLGDFLATLEGLSAQRLKENLTAPGRSGRIDFEIKLAGGRKLHLLGAFESTAHARGLLFGTEIVAGEASQVPVEAVFQPIIRLADGKVAGFEALARWRDPEGILKPAGAIEGPSRNLVTRGLAVAMLGQAQAAMADWSVRFPQKQLFIQVNLTGADLYRADVLLKVGEVVQSGVFQPGGLKIELTEQMALRDFEAGVAAATALEALGATLVLDDFGSGHSSLAWLASIPATGIKLDPQLTQMPAGPRIDAIFTSVVGLANQLGMSVTAEGIEDFSRIEFLRSIGCDFVQGYAYARPMEKQKADVFLENEE